ncbi:MAG: lipopolysaccharide heptosyltransferase II [Thiohalomonadales bacterium]
MSDQDAILVVGPSWVGDMVMAQSLYKTLKQFSPEISIDVLAPAWSQPILVRMREVRHSINQPVGHGVLNIQARFRLGRSLQPKNYRQAYIIPRSMKAALIPFFAGIPKRTAYRGELRFGVVNDIRPLDKNILQQTVQRYVALAYTDLRDTIPSIPHPQLDIDEDNRNTLLERFKLGNQTKIVALLPGAEYGPAKLWPVSHYGALAKKLVAQGLSVWILGSQRDNPMAEKIRRMGGETVANLCGKTQLEDAVDLMSLASVVVSNDSGLMHVAASVDRPLVALYGSSTPDYTPPLSNKARVVYKKLDCSPCFKRVCPLGHTNCLNFITVDEVYDKVKEQLKKYKDIEIQ